MNLEDRLETSEAVLKFEEQIKVEAEKIKAKKEPEKEVLTKEESKETESSKDPYLEEAVKMGFNPNYDGPDKKTPEQFVKDGSFFRKIDEQKKEIDSLKKLFKESEERYIKFEKAKKSQIIQELQDKKLKAVEEGDKDAFLGIDEKIRVEFDELNKLDKPLNTDEIKTTPEVVPEIKEFMDRNKTWFNLETPENQLMAKTADGLAAVVAEEARINGEDIDISEQLRRVEERIKTIFPKRFENTNKKKPSMVATSTVSKSTSDSLSGRLSEKQRKTFKDAKKYGLKITEEEYAKRLQLTGELRDE